jgi:hypothetical protein
MHPRLGQAAVAVTLPVERARLELPTPGAVEGVLTERGAPANADRWEIEAVRVDASSDSGMPWIPGRATLGADGAFRIDGLTPGRYRVSARPSVGGVRSLGALVGLIESQVFASSLGSRAAAERQVDVPGGAVARADLEIAEPAQRERPVGSLRGSVTIDGIPASGARIRESQCWEARTLTTVAEDGRFALPGLEVGEQRLSIVQVAGEGTLWRGTVRIAADQEASLDLALTTSVVRGRALAPDGTPARRVTVAASGAVGAGGISEQETTTDDDGRFTFERLLAGSYTFALHTDRLAGELRDVVIAPGDNPPIELATVPVYTVRGRVVDGGTLPAGSMIVLRRIDGGSHGYLLDRDATFAMAGLHPGEFEVRLHVGGLGTFATEPARVRIDRADVEVALRRGALVR